MTQTSGFTKLQKEELAVIFADQFKEVVMPGLDDLVVRMQRLEERIGVIEEKIDQLRADFYDLKRRILDLENNTVEFKSYLDLRSRVEKLEKRVGIAIK